MSLPKLTERGTKYFLSETLKNCNKNRIYYSNIMFNLSLLILFLVILGLYLGFKYEFKKNNKIDTKEKSIEVENYILSKLGNVFYENQIKKDNMLTNLPKFESDYELLHEKFYNV
jgi:hypothetical protein